MLVGESVLNCIIAPVIGREAQLITNGIGNTISNIYNSKQALLKNFLLIQNSNFLDYG
jgi:hypothetical protein